MPCSVHFSSTAAYAVYLQCIWSLLSHYYRPQLYEAPCGTPILCLSAISHWWEGWGWPSNWPLCYSNSVWDTKRRLGSLLAHLSFVMTKHLRCFSADWLMRQELPDNVIHNISMFVYLGYYGCHGMSLYRCQQYINAILNIATAVHQKGTVSSTFPSMRRDNEFSWNPAWVTDLDLTKSTWLLVGDRVIQQKFIYFAFFCGERVYDPEKKHGNLPEGQIVPCFSVMD